MNDTRTPSKEDYALAAAEAGGLIEAPAIPYLPRDPLSYRPNIALIGAGGISQYHLAAYRRAGYPVVAICDLDLERAKRRRDEYFPEATITTNVAEILTHADIAVVDIATHPGERVALIEAAIDAGKHVLSQKPFVLDLDVGEALVARAAKNNVKLAVNQNGRWAPHFAYMRGAVKAGEIGDLQSVHLRVHWNHSWTKGTPFDDIEDLVFYDFAIHWFDFLASIVGSRATTVFATRAHALGQVNRVPMLAQALVELDGGQASLAFDADSHFGPLDSTYVAGTAGSLVSVGPDLRHQDVTLYANVGVARPRLEGDWFTNGFHGTMAELLCAVEEDREPTNSARDNLKSLQLCFAAIESSHTRRPVRLGEARRLHVID